eukprot:scaffold147325_cov36-Tisochrysis_lutea.AAC.1
MEEESAVAMTLKTVESGAANITTHSTEPYNPRTNDRLCSLTRPKTRPPARAILSATPAVTMICTERRVSAERISGSVAT